MQIRRTEKRVSREMSRGRDDVVGVEGRCGVGRKVEDGEGEARRGEEEEDAEGDREAREEYSCAE